MAVRAPARAPAGERAAGTFELWAWFFMRISGIVLVFLVLGHLTIVHLLGSGVNRVNFAFVSGRWASPFWQTWDWTMLFLALLHGTNGMRMVIDDYIGKPGRRAAVKSALYVTAFILLLLGTLIILTFDPSKGHSSVLGG